MGQKVHGGILGTALLAERMMNYNEQIRRYPTP